MNTEKSVAIIGAGPAGLIAAERLSAAGCAVTIYERMPSPARKFLLAGRGGLNLTHSEPLAAFLARYPDLPDALAKAIRDFPPSALRDWAAALGEDTFVGSSGRVFPKSFKATPLLRAWLKRLESQGVRFALRHRWTGWSDDGALRFETPEEAISITADAVLLALGGASWPRLGSDGGWSAILRGVGVDVAPLVASNCGALIAWSEPFRARHHGRPLKASRFAVGGDEARSEAVITRHGLEGGALYALSGAIRAALDAGAAELVIDLKPDTAHAVLAERLGASRKGESLANRLRKAAGLSPAAIGILRESMDGPLPGAPDALAARIKHCRLIVAGLAPIERAISTAGGVPLDAIDAHFMLKQRPGTFVAGEMLDWDAPTGGYLLTACYATGVAAAAGMATRLAQDRNGPATGSS